MGKASFAVILDGKGTIQSYLSVNDLGDDYLAFKDYDIGDIVTVINESLNLTADVRVTSVTVTQDTNGYSVTPTLGDAQPTLYSVLKKKGVVI